MKLWIGLFVALFGLAELFQWFRHFALPLPIFILGGAFLAIASNSDKRTGLPFLSDSLANTLSNRLDSPQTPLRPITPPTSSASSSASATPSAPPIAKPTTQPSGSSPTAKSPTEPTLPTFHSDSSRYTRSISFTIRKSEDDGAGLS